MSTNTNNIPSSIDEAIRQHRRDIEIPRQLSGCRFIKLVGKTKTAKDKGYLEHPYTFDDPELLNHINNMGENYGVVLKNGVCAFDCDTEELFTSLPATLRDGTFTVKSGRDDGGYHVYFKCLDAPPLKVVLEDAEGNALGDVRFSGHRSYLVGAGSIHNKSGKQYRVINDKPLQELKFDEVREILGKFVNNLEEEETHLSESLFAGIQKQAARNPDSRTITDKYNLKVESFLYPTDAKVCGNLIRGSHPVHGSDSGHNLEIDTSKNVWYCFRCNAGGGPIEAYAVSRGIIQCRESNGKYTKDQWHAILEGLEREGFCKFPRIKPATSLSGLFKGDSVRDIKRMKILSQELQTARRGMIECSKR